MKFTEQDLISAFKAFVDNKGWIYFVGNPEYNAQILIDYMKEHQEPIDEDELAECIPFDINKLGKITD